MERPDTDKDIINRYCYRLSEECVFIDGIEKNPNDANAIGVTNSACGGSCI